MTPAFRIANIFWISGEEEITADINSTFTIYLNGDAAVSPLIGNSSQHSSGVSDLPRRSDLTTL